MKLSTVPKDYIINAATETGGKVVSNFLLHGLCIKNDSGEAIILKEINFEMYASGRFIKQLTYKGEALQNAVKEFAEKATWLDKGFGAKLFLGEEGFYNPEYYIESVEMKSGYETGIWNEYFIAVYNERIDLLKIKVLFCKDGGDFLEEMEIPVVEYKNKNLYTFPLKGSIQTCGNFNCLVNHRQHYSMEFAFDMAQLNADQKLCFKENMRQEDYVAFGKEVLAIADGEVVDCYHSFPIATSWDWELRRPYIDEYGLAAQCGNFVVLKHANEEYSFYGHLITDSLTVKKGDRVKQGQVIAKLGHTGMSGCPHLHFQLMDGPDFFSARGLPCSFTNIKDIEGKQITSIQEDNLIVHAE